MSGISFELVLEPFFEFVLKESCLLLSSIFSLLLVLLHQESSEIWSSWNVSWDLLLLKVNGTCPKLEICIKEFFICLLVNVFSLACELCTCYLEIVFFSLWSGRKTWFGWIKLDLTELFYISRESLGAEIMNSFFIKVIIFIIFFIVGVIFFF